MTELRCPCGKAFRVQECRVRQGRKYCSKGCAKGKQGPVAAPFFWLYNKLKRSADRRRYNQVMSFEEFLTLTKETACHYCGAELQWSAYSSTLGKINGAMYNLDRKDNNLGYTKDNVVPCCRRCNWGKGDMFTYEQWVQIGKVIQTFA